MMVSKHIFIVNKKKCQWIVLIICHSIKMCVALLIGNKNSLKSFRLHAGSDVILLKKWKHCFLETDVFEFPSVWFSLFCKNRSGFLHHPTGRLNLHDIAALFPRASQCLWTLLGPRWLDWSERRNNRSVQIRINRKLIKNEGWDIEKTKSNYI